MMLGRVEGSAIRVLVKVAPSVPVVGSTHSMFTPTCLDRFTWKGLSCQSAKSVWMLWES